MYPSRARGGYRKPPYGSQSGYPHNLGSAYPGSSVSGADGGSQIPHPHPSSVTGNAPQETDIGGYRSHYGTQYGSSGSYGHGQNADDLHRRQFGDRSSAYLSRELHNETTARYADSSSFGRQTGLYDRFDQASFHTSAVDGGVRQADYLTERSSALRHSNQEAMHYGRRLGSDIHGLSVQNTSSYSSQDASFLGAAPRSSNPGYGVSLPPGRDYGTGKGILTAASLDNRASYLREFEQREEERRRENLLARYQERERVRKRDKERKHDRKRALETKRDTTSKSVSRDAHHREASIRRPSLIRPIRRDYARKVLSSRLVDMERDYLALDKRYPRLFVPSEFSKVVVNWPKQKLILSMHTAGDGGVDLKYTPTKSLAVKTGGKTVWNAKMILMSVLSRTAREDIASEKIFEDCIPHICNILKFAVLKKDHAFMATGGPWDPTDGMDPSVDQSSLIKTILRHTKDKLHLDLSNCRHWNPFLEIHYDRAGTDGVSSFKEITVLFVPDLSECLPSFDAWSTQWLEHKKTLIERDQLRSQEVEKDVIVGKGSNDGGNVAEKKASGSSVPATGKKDEKSDEKGVERPAENEEKGSEIIVGAQTGESSDPGAKANEESPSKTIVKNVAEVDNNMDSDSKVDGDDDEKKEVEAGSNEMKSPEEKKEESASETVETKQTSLSPDTEQKEGASSSTKKDIKTSEDKKTETKNNSEMQSEGEKVDEKKAKEKFIEKEIKERGGNDESRTQVKDKKSEEPPRPGFILQVKRNEDSKLRSLSVSLDSLLDYTDKDSDESSFEVSLFAESLFEMLQYQMGTCILEFLKKLRLKFVSQRDQRKRHQEELSAKQKEAKRQKTVDHNDKETPPITESVPEKDDKETSAKEAVENTEDALGIEKTTGDEAATMEVDNQDEEGGEDDEKDEDPEEDPAEDPEEDPDEREEMDHEQEKKEENKKNVADPITEVATDRNEEKGSIAEKTDSKSAEIKPKSDPDKQGKQEEGTSDAPKREETVDKELLQAFRFFDRDQTGYVRVEDMRVTIHSLGKFISQREVKELVQSALLESNTGRDDRIVYKNLVRLSL